jgi:hypothetical protein
LNFTPTYIISMGVETNIHAACLFHSLHAAEEALLARRIHAINDPNRRILRDIGALLVIGIRNGGVLDGTRGAYAIELPSCNLGASFPALGSRDLSLAGKSDSTRYTVASEGFARPYFVRIRSCASNRRRLSSPHRCRLARFRSAFFEVGAGNSDSDSEFAVGRVAICAGSREKEGLHPGVVSIAVGGKNAVRAQICAKRQRPPCRSNRRAFRRVATSLGHGRTQPPRGQGVGGNAASGRPPGDSVHCIAQNCRVF